MDAFQPKKNEQPSLNAYFRDSSDSNIFDQLSQNVSRNDENSPMIAETTFIETNECVKTLKSRDPDPPIISTIFNADSVESTTKDNEGTFFDMIGNDQKLPPNEIISKAKLISELPSDGSFFSSPLTTDVDGDPVNDGLFMKNIPSISNISSSSESDRRRDAWIPSNRTRQALLTVATASPGSYVLDKELLTMPGVILQEDMLDNVHEAVNHYLGEVETAQRKVLTINDVTQDERGLRELIQADCFRAAVNLTSRLLTMYGQGIGRAGCPSKHTLHSIQLWFTRIALLVKLRSWSVAWAEAEPWWDLDKSDLYFQFYSELYGGRPGTIVPFSFRLLLAELPQYVHKPQEALKRLFSVLSVIRKILRNLSNNLSEDGSRIEITVLDCEESKKLWRMREARVLHSIINLAFQQKDYKLGIDVLNTLMDNANVDGSVYHRRALLSAMGRLYLQLGDLTVAKTWFDKSCSLKSNNQIKTSADFQECVDYGLLALADGVYDKAYEYFHKASLKDPTNIMVKNNMAVCLLYCGKQKDAVNLLEAVVSTNPTYGLHESLLLNLCTLYELESSTAMENKYKMLKLVSMYKGDAISLHCLKLQIKE